MLLLSQAGLMGLKSPPGSQVPPLAALLKPSQARTPHPTCHFPPLLSQMGPGHHPPLLPALLVPPPPPQGCSLPPHLALATSNCGPCLSPSHPGAIVGPEGGGLSICTGPPVCPPRPSAPAHRSPPAARKLLPPPGTHPVSYCRFHIYVISYGICLSLSDLLH